MVDCGTLNVEQESPDGGGDGDGLTDRNRLILLGAIAVGGFLAATGELKNG